MAKAGYMSGSDAAYIEPKLIPDNELRARDNSGGIDYVPYSATFGDGGLVTGSKNHLSARGGGDGEGLEAERDELETSRRPGYASIGKSGKAGKFIDGRKEQIANRKREGED